MFKHHTTQMSKEPLYDLLIKETPWIMKLRLDDNIKWYLIYFSFISDKLPKDLLKARDEGLELFNNHCKTYWDKLRSINPPCVPFFGQYQTKLVFAQEANKDFLAETNLINFTKRRKVADIISEIQQYQNQPYCLKPSTEIRAFLENLDPFPDMKNREGQNDEPKINDYLWNKSTEVEPKDAAKRKPVSVLV